MSDLKEEPRASARRADSDAVTGREGSQVPESGATASGGASGGLPGQPVGTEDRLSAIRERSRGGKYSAPYIYNRTDEDVRWLLDQLAIYENQVEVYQKDMSFYQTGLEEANHKIEQYHRIDADRED